MNANNVIAFCYQPLIFHTLESHTPANSMSGKRPAKPNEYTVHNKVKIIRGGADYFNAIEKIADEAKHFLHLQTYIFDGDETGQKVAAALIRAAKRKVKVYLLVDAYASQHLSKAFIAMLKEGGVHFGFFSPVFKGNFFYMGRRLHHKIIVADSCVCMVAGINVSNRYNDMGATKAWLDWAVYAEGEVAKGINAICVKLWNRSVFRKKCSMGPVVCQLPQEECKVRIRRNDWVFKQTQITNSYRELFGHAHKEVTVMTSYFWPPQKLLNRMAAASRRGVKIRLILTATADVPFSKYTERYLYNWLFRHNIEIYEYTRNVLHGKIGVSDNERLTAGSYNVNNISAFASVELNLDILDRAVATEVSNKLDEIIRNDCERVTAESFAAASNLMLRFFYYCSYRITHAIFYLFTFYFTQKREPA